MVFHDAGKRRFHRERHEDFAAELFRPAGSASPAAPGWYSHTPLRLSQSARTNCGRG